jgi:hypothetical protein
LTFKDLRKRINLEAPQQQSRLFERLQNRPPFWIWNIEEHKHKQQDIRTNGDCCFDQIIDYLKKGVDKQIINYMVQQRQRQR